MTTGVIMRSLRKRITILAIPVLGLSMLSACYIGVRPAYRGDVVVDPGYYYDTDYVDVYGIYHPRVYYYYHEGRWDHRDFVPHGYYARARVYRR
jgi:hypothetical protein